jgi:hypothetical protein
MDRVIVSEATLDDLVKKSKSRFFRHSGESRNQDILNPGACPGPDPGFAGVTTQEIS